jgi:hypothetical protein
VNEAKDGKLMKPLTALTTVITLLILVLPYTNAFG